MLRYWVLGIIIYYLVIVEVGYDMLYMLIYLNLIILNEWYVKFIIYSLIIINYGFIDKNFCYEL